MFKPIALLFAGSLFLSACGSHSSPNLKGTVSMAGEKEDDDQNSVETKAANTDYKPAFAGQTRIGAVKTATAYEGKVLTSDLKSPWGIAVLPDGRFLITEKAGTMRIVTSAGKVSEPITGLPPVKFAAQGGLLGLTIDPQFGSNRMVYWTFSEARPDGNLTAVAKGKLSADEKKIEGATVIYRATPAHKSVLHYGGRILFDKTGSLMVSTGERSDLQTRPLAQDKNTSLGKVLRITKDGQAAAGNPFAGQANVRPEIYSFGHRNVQGLAFNPNTGDLWETEFGPRGGDEVNRVQAGKNYGWPAITYGLEYSGQKVGPGNTQQAGMEQPVYYWDPVVSPSGIVFYNGNNMPEWKGNLFVSCLSGSHVDRLVIRNNKVVGEERLLADKSERFRDITVGKDGALYTITDGGKLYRIGKK